MQADSPRKRADDDAAAGVPLPAACPSVHTRMMELLFVTGDSVKLSVGQITSILGVDSAAVVAELSSNPFVKYDAEKQSVSLLRERPMAGRAGKGPGVRTPLDDDGGDNGDNNGGGAEPRDRRKSRKNSNESGSSSENEEEEYTPHLPRRPYEVAVGGGGGGGERRAQRGSTSTAGTKPSSPLQRILSSLAAQSSPRRDAQESLEKQRQRRHSSSSGVRRRRVAVPRMGSSNPLHPYGPSAMEPTGVGRERKGKSGLGDKLGGPDGGGDGGTPLDSLLSGRVGYVCVAEEFKLSEMQGFYSNLGYFTKFDLGVLHVRLREDSTFPAEGVSKIYDDVKQQPATMDDRACSPTTITFIRQRKSNFDLFLFEYGAVVWWGSDERFFKLVETDFLLPDGGASPFMVNRYPTQLVTENYPVWCSYSLVKKESLDVDDDFKKKLRFDHFLIPFGRRGEDASLCGTTMLCCSHALAQSAKIDYVELKVQELTEACAPLPRELRLKGRASITERRLLQLRGEVLSYRLMLNSESDLLDEPDFFWENAYLKPIFEATKEGFGVDYRVEALDNKLDASNEILSMLAEEFSQRHGARLEWIVIWLVFVEVIIGVLELAVDVKPWFLRR